MSRHLLSHVPAEVFPETIKWACYAIGHQAVKLYDAWPVFQTGSGGVQGDQRLLPAGDHPGRTPDSPKVQLQGTT